MWKEMIEVDVDARYFWVQLFYLKKKQTIRKNKTTLCIAWAQRLKSKR